MRTAFIEHLQKEARANPRIFLVVGDLGFSVVEPFAKEFPDRFLNAGVAEQNMTGLAAGLASEGFHVFTYSIANFPTLRCLEQIRNDVCYHDLPVTVTAVGGGLSYGNLGYSHHGVQDLGIMRSLPGLDVFAPADPGETRESLGWILRNPGPSYLRLGKSGEPCLHEKTGIETGPIFVRTTGSKIALLSTGSVLLNCLEAADRLEKRDIQVDVISCPWLTPRSPGFFQSLEGYGHIIVVEEHVRAGGVFEMLSGLLKRSVELHSLCISPEVSRFVGSQVHLRNVAGLGAENIVALVEGLESR